MSVQIAQGMTPKIVWDDGVVLVFTFDVTNGSGGTTTFTSGFAHIPVQPAAAFGDEAGVTNILATTQPNVIMFASDPESWVETIKTAHRAAADGSGMTVDICFDDSVSTPYDTQTDQNFTLQMLFSIAG